LPDREGGQQQTIDVTLLPEDQSRLARLCGQFDANIRQIEERLRLRIASRGNHFELTGDAGNAQVGASVLEDLYEATATEEIDPQRVHLVLSELSREEPGARESMIIHTRRREVRARGPHQREYAQAMRSKDLTFGIGPAGTGKTYMAVAAAVEALDTDKVRRLVLVRPAVEAGERLGFLPGDMSQKVDPYLRPMYDALYEMMGFERVARLIERHVIEIAPLAFMRGRTLNESFVILDEAQNTTVEQMKMLLTRIGYGSRAVVTGDVTQTDLPKGRESGLRHVMRVLANIDSIAFVHFDARDVVRHPLVRQIVDAYARDERSNGEAQD
jgi:phosphate starvation-inducible PhoH-like protein